MAPKFALSISVIPEVCAGVCWALLFQGIEIVVFWFRPCDGAKVPFDVVI